MSQFNATTYDIQRPTGVCAFTGRTLEPGETYYATLIELPDDIDTEAQPSASSEPLAETAGAAGSNPSTPTSPENALGLKRLDVSADAWQQGNRPDHLFSFWKSTVAQPTEKKKLFVDDGVLMNLLRRLENTDKPQRLAFRYVLALILMRKKLVRYDGTEDTTETVDGETVTRQYWKLTPKLDVSKGHMGKWNEDETLRVLDPKLDVTQIEQVTTQLGEILEAEL